jgi:hypothetical protein
MDNEREGFGQVPVATGYNPCSNDATMSAQMGPLIQLQPSMSGHTRRLCPPLLMYRAILPHGLAYQCSIAKCYNVV